MDENTVEYVEDNSKAALVKKSLIIGTVVVGAVTAAGLVVNRFRNRNNEVTIEEPEDLIVTPIVKTPKDK